MQSTLTLLFVAVLTVPRLGVADADSVRDAVRDQPPLCDVYPCTWCTNEDWVNPTVHIPITKDNQVGTRLNAGIDLTKLASPASIDSTAHLATPMRVVTNPKKCVGYLPAGSGGSFSNNLLQQNLGETIKTQISQFISLDTFISNEEPYGYQNSEMMSTISSAKAAYLALRSQCTWPEYKTEWTTFVSAKVYNFYYGQRGAIPCFKYDKTFLDDLAALPPDYSNDTQSYANFVQKFGSVVPTGFTIGTSYSGNFDISPDSSNLTSVLNTQLPVPNVTCSDPQTFIYTYGAWSELDLPDSSASQGKLSELSTFVSSGQGATADGSVPMSPPADTFAMPTNCLDNSIYSMAASDAQLKRTKSRAGHLKVANLFR